MCAVCDVCVVCGVCSSVVGIYTTLLNAETSTDTPSGGGHLRLLLVSHHVVLAARHCMVPPSSLLLPLPSISYFYLLPLLFPPCFLPPSTSRPFSLPSLSPTPHTLSSLSSFATTCKDHPVQLWDAFDLQKRASYTPHNHLVQSRPQSPIYGGGGGGGGLCLPRLTFAEIPKFASN